MEPLRYSGILTVFIEWKALKIINNKSRIYFSVGIIINAKYLLCLSFSSHNSKSYKLSARKIIIVFTHLTSTYIYIYILIRRGFNFKYISESLLVLPPSGFSTSDLWNNTSYIIVIILCVHCRNCLRRNFGFGVTV